MSAPEQSESPRDSPAARAGPGWRRQDHDIPSVGLGVDHRLDLADRLMCRRDLDDFDPGLLREGLVEAFLPGLGPRPAGIANDERTRGPSAVDIDVRQGERGRSPGEDRAARKTRLIFPVIIGSLLAWLLCGTCRRQAWPETRRDCDSLPIIRRRASVASPARGPAALELKWMRIAKR